ncbi:DgyrCDS8860 [Dimorphilus gyrociliatus]|uniref:Elongation of very long chain fatty acids protein n=1 Tax=Dimorphilus gyrociliatus TaxID=2664684 RepID=A0A7I8VXP9_9ANNE|nr:DgyrCDS8860 [Dimorphilus gyrociliatus]
MSLIEQVVNYAQSVMAKADPRTDGMLLMDSPWLSLSICILYVIFVQVIGPKLMANREPFKLKELMIVYNFAMVILSGYIFMEFGICGWFGNYSYGCQPVDYSNSPNALRMLRVCQLFHLSKYIELLDTVIFVLRKKFNQISFLHVFHHGVMPISWWFGVKFVAGGFGTFHGWLNSWIHFMMYIYYGIAGLGPAYQKYIWWKKYMTSLQLLQFALVTIHSIQLFFIPCNYPVLFTWWILSYAVIFFAMFSNFYVKAYKKPKKEAVRNGVHNGKDKKGD